MTEKEIGTLAIGEPHPSSHSAYKYIKKVVDGDGAFKWVEAFASCAIDGNRLAEVCGETLRRILAAEPVSDRYVLGLAWTLKEMNERKNK